MFEGQHHVRVRYAIAEMNAKDMEGVWVTGGAFRSFVDNAPLNDIDVVFSSDEAHDLWFKHMVKQGAKIHDRLPIVSLGQIHYDHSILIRRPTPHDWVDFADFTCGAGVLDTKLNLTTHANHVSDVLNKELRLWKGWERDGRGVSRVFKMLNLGYEPPEGRLKFFDQVINRLKAK